MLIKFATRNFRGFSKKIEWDLSTPREYDYNLYAIKDGVIKNGIIYGPNGSGKSNFGFALFDIVNHLTQKNKQEDFYKNFVCGDNPNGLVEFEYTFRFGNDIVEYLYTKDSTGDLVDEWMNVNGKPSFEKKNGETKVDSSFIVNQQAFDKLLSFNSNKVSVVSFLLSSIPLPEDHYLIKLNQFVNSMLWFRNLDVRGYIGLQTGSTSLDEYIIKSGHLHDFENFLNEISGQKFDLFFPKFDDKHIYCRIGKSVMSFNKIVSTGTRSLMLLYYWILNIEDAKFVFVDEFDAFYHFELSYQVCKRLFGLNCQAFVTSHNTYLMTNELLRPDCNFILDKNIIKPLCDCTEKDLRFAHNIEKLYRGNTFNVL